MEEPTERTHAHSCGYDCPFWDSGQGYDHSSCTIPKCVPFDCHSRCGYEFNPDDFVDYIAHSFYPNVRLVFSAAETAILSNRGYIEGRLRGLIGRGFLGADNRAAAQTVLLALGGAGVETANGTILL